MARAGAGRRSGGGRGALIPNRRRTAAERAADDERRRARRRRLPAPGTAAASRLLARYTPDTAEAAFLKRAALAEALSKDGPGPYTAELRELRERAYRAAYNASRPARPKAKPKAKAWTWVKRHRRRIRRA